MNKDKIKSKAKKIKLVILDVDGVLSDGRIIYDDRGRELKSFFARDGAGIVYLQRSGIEVAILSGRASGSVDIRAKELGITRVHQGSKRKLEVLEELLEKTGLGFEELAFMGDDLMDLPALRRVGLAAAPANAVPEVKRVAHVITKAEGGRGAVREFAELVIRAQGKWKKITARYME
jgi:3-deoxy-D-manno-octulosonate 8-phosphate phosphatase (KDO 8-P phosphatase)